MRWANSTFTERLPREGSSDLSNSGGKAADVERYDLKNDVAEEFNMADKHQKEVRELTEELRRIVDWGTSHM